MTMILVVAFLLDMGYIADITFTVGVSGPLATYSTITNNSGLSSLASSLVPQTWVIVFQYVMIIFRWVACDFRKQVDKDCK